MNIYFDEEFCPHCDLAIDPEEGMCMNCYYQDRKNEDRND